MAAGCRRHLQLPLSRPAAPAAAYLVARPGATDRERTRTEQRPDATLSDAARRRHAATATVSVLARAADPFGRRLMGESPRLPEWPSVV
jgi:hypothetical protein